MNITSPVRVFPALLQGYLGRISPLQTVVYNSDLRFNNTEDPRALAEKELRNRPYRPGTD